MTRPLQQVDESALDGFAFPRARLQDPFKFFESEVSRGMAQDIINKFLFAPFELFTQD
jgi:hypothetical protein